MSKLTELVYPTYTGRFITENDREWLDECLAPNYYFPLDDAFISPPDEDATRYQVSRVWETNTSTPTRVFWTFILFDLEASTNTVQGLAVHPDHRNKGVWNTWKKESSKYWLTNSSNFNVRIESSPNANPYWANRDASSPWKRLFLREGLVVENAERPDLEEWVETL